MNRTVNRRKNKRLLGILLVLFLGFLATPTFAATITNLSPYAARTDTIVIVYGSGFGTTRGSSTVTFGTTPVTTYVSWADTMVQVRVPANQAPGATQVKATVGGVDSNTWAFTVLPKNNSITPSSGRVGDAVTIAGDSYGADPGAGNRSTATHHVTFADSAKTNVVQVPDAGVTSWSQNQIACNVPLGVLPGTMLVTVYSVSDNSNAVYFTVKPNITALTPSSGAIGSTVTITGTTFGPDPGAGNRSTASYNVKFGTVTVEAADVTKWTSAEIVCKVPAGASTGNVTVTANGATSAGVNFIIPPPIISSVTPESGPNGDSPWTTYVNINGSNFGSSQGNNVVNFNSVDAGAAALWNDSRIVIAVPSSVGVGSAVAVSVTVNGAPSNSGTFTPVQGQMIDNYEDTGMYNTPYHSAGGADEVNISDLYRVTNPSYDGQYSMQIRYPGATGSQWGGYWGTDLKPTLTDLDLTSCNMLVFRMKGDGSNNTIRLDVKEFKDGANDEAYSSLDRYSLSDSSGFKEYKIPFSRLVRNDYATSVQEDNVFSKKIKGYTFIYGGTDPSSAFHQVDFVYAVNWTGPIIDQIGPNFGTIGDYITIEGSGFGPSQGTITFNGVPAVPTSWNDTQIVVQVPAGATTGPVAVTVGPDTSNYVDFIVTSVAGPAITGIDPTLGRSGTPVTISGSNFGDDPGADNRASVSNHVVFGATKVTNSNMISWSPTAIVVYIPDMSDGVYPVQVRAGDKDSNMVDFTVSVVVTAPTVTAVSPASGTSPNTDITITGTDFTNVTGIVIGTTPITAYTVSSDTSITGVSIPAGLADGAYDIQVTNSIGQSPINAPADQYTVTAAGVPTVTAVYPNSRDNTQDTSIMISGTNFTGVNWVHLGSINLSFSVADATMIIATVPSGLTPGTYDIQVTNSVGQSPINAPADQYTVMTPPVVDSVTPESGPYGDSPWTTYVNIKGSNFGSTQDASTVSFDSTDAGKAVLWSDSRIVVAFPASGRFGAGSPTAVIVTVNGMQSNSDKIFTPVLGKIIDNYEYTSMQSYFNSKADANQVGIPVPTRVTSQYYDGRYAMQVRYPGATGSQWGGDWGGSLKLPLTELDLTSCNMLVFSVKGDGSNNTIRLDVMESGDVNTKAEPYSSLDKYPLSDSSGFREYKIPFSRLWRNEYSGAAKDDDVFSKMIQSYTFVYQGTNSNSAYHYVDFVYAVGWSGPIIDQIGPNFGAIGDYVTIEGSGFGPSQGTITFNGVPAVPTSWNDTQIVVTVPAGATTGPVGVTVGSDTSNYVDFTVTTDAGPTISDIAPTSGSAGTTQVTISGSNFGDDPGIDYRATASNHVVFGTAKVTDSDLGRNVISWSSTQIEVIVPASLANGIYPVQVRAGDKESNMADFTVGGGGTESKNYVLRSTANGNFNWIALAYTNTGLATTTDLAASIGNAIPAGSRNAWVDVVEVRAWDAANQQEITYSCMWDGSTWNDGGVSAPLTVGAMYKVTVPAAADGLTWSISGTKPAAGSVQFTLNNVTNGNYNWVTIPAYTQGISTTTDLAASIGNTIPAGSRNAWVDVVEVRAWDAANQQEITYSCMWDGSTWNDGGVNAPVNVPDAYVVTVPAIANGNIWP